MNNTPLNQLRIQIDCLATDLVSSGSTQQVIAGLLQLCGMEPDATEIRNAVLSVQEASMCEDSTNRHESLAKSIAELRSLVAAYEPQEKSLSGPNPSAFGNLMEDPELVQDFIMETLEHLSSIESGLLKIEEDPSLTEPIHSVFRSFHTIKGLAGFLELDSIREVSHEVETILDLARNLKLQMGPTVIDVVLASADYLRQAVGVVEEGLHGCTKPFIPPGDLLKKVRALTVTNSEGATTDSPKIGIENCTPVIVIPVTKAKPTETQEPESSKPTTAQIEEIQQGASDKRAQDGNSESTNENSQFSIRVETAKLDHLLDMVGELVIAQSLVRHDPTLTDTGNVRLQAHVAHLNRITDEVQKTTMTLRMVPIGNLFQRMKRLVRDMARKSGKHAELELVGEDTELDKTVVDGLADPLMHMVRNALDHGVESAIDRQATGKPTAARICIKAYHQGGHMVIEISDDGRGLNREKILSKARQNGLIGENLYLTDPEICQLIFEPGFSTAEKVTDISGRGVGMDVVKRNIVKMRGRVDIHSVPGAGTTFFIRLPLTLAIIDGLVVGVGTQRYVVPIFAVTEMFRPTREMLSSLENKYEMVMVRGRLLPIVRLHCRFGITPKSDDPCQSLFIVTESEGIRFCLMVDEFIGKQEVVIKGLGEFFKSIPGIVGGAILGDGRVGLILEMAGLACEQGGVA